MASWTSPHASTRRSSALNPPFSTYLAICLTLCIPYINAIPVAKSNPQNVDRTPKSNPNTLFYIPPNSGASHQAFDTRNIELMQQDVYLKSKSETPRGEGAEKVLWESPLKGNVGFGYRRFSEWECNICKLVVTLIRTLTAQEKAKSEIQSVLTKFCIDMKIEDRNVCTAVILEFQNEVLTVLERLALSPDEICGFIYGDQCARVYNPYTMWNVTFPEKPKPPVIPPKPPKSGSPVIRVLQLSDIHLDPDYKSGSNADCGEPLCCHEDDGPPKGKPAGHWGDYRQCDTPPWLLENLFQHLKTNEKFDYIYWTGDLPNHLVWNQTRSEQQRLVGYLTKLLLKYFPNTLILPSVGNHESAPANSFPPPFVKGDDSIDWLYRTLASNWTVWLPNSTINDILKGAYYTVLVKPGFRIVSINTNYCNNMNWWLLLNTTDPAEELQWLIKVLQAAEDNQEKVHILGHSPTGISTCLQAWSWNYYKIISRYENTVAGQFFGHTHTDYVTIFYDDVTLKRPVSVSYVSPSVTTFASALGTNPSYRIYEIDGGYHGASWEVLNHQTFMINLTEANLHPQQSPKWYMEYDAKTAYNLTSLYPADWDGLIERMKTDDALFKKYHQFYYHGHPPEGGCDSRCKREFLCEAKSGRSYDQVHLCKDLH